MKYFICLLVIIFGTVHEGFALQCWKCSSDITKICSDPFNTSDILALRSGGGSLYSNLQQNYNQRQYDQNYNQNYNPNYNPSYNQQGFNPNYNPNYADRNLPTLETCDENEARIRRMRPVCMKEIVRGTSYTGIIRRCSMIPLEQYVGTCQRPTGAGLSLDFCETCEYDGCNSATGLKTNAFLAFVLAVLSILIFRR